ncbi:sulfotransferase 1 family member D1-like isoform X2 [Lycorma delicatula]|uniref:sulfotransferase 1 family member D1-like isoform X2 n=1 Tax=Lycorma delicatula TaxID=130591 RepID=UPI003F50F49D
MYPYTIEPVEKELNEELMNYFKGERKGFCRVGPEEWILPLRYMDQAEGYYNMPLRNDDVWIMTYPRSGTTWCQELVWLINNNLNYEKALKIPMDKRFPFLEFGILHSPELHKEVLDLNNNNPDIDTYLASWRQPGYEWAENMASPRHFKTHLPLMLLPPNLLNTCKVIYVARNPKDVAVSYYHHNRLLKVHDYVGDFETYWNLFEKNLLAYSPYWTHIKQAWSKRNHPNMLFLFYEDMIKDLPQVLDTTAKFLKKMLTKDQVSQLADHLHIDNFRKNVPLNKKTVIKGLIREGEQSFIRKGKIGGNTEFTIELEEQADKWVKSNLEKIDFKFPEK